MTWKSLHLTNAWHETSGGISTFYRALFAAAERRGHLIRLVVPGPRNQREDVGRYGRIIYVAAGRAPLNRAYRTMLPHQFLRSQGEVARIIREERPDLIEICDKYSLQYLGGLLREGWLAQFDGRPTVIGLSCERMDENVAAYLLPGQLGAWLSRWYMKWLYFPMFDHHIANSRHTAVELAGAARGHKVQRGVWLGPMGVDLATFSPERRTAAARKDLARRAGVSPDKLLLLYAGRLVREKNLGLLTEMMEALGAEGADHFHLLIVGAGDLRPALEAAAARLSGRVSLLGHVAGRGELANLYANADFFVHPNPKEPFGIAPLEAMASGLPLVAPNAGGLTTYANNANAWLAEPNAASFAMVIRAAERDPVERETRRAAALETAARYGWDAAADYFLDLYQQLHALRIGETATPAIPPLFVSTPGDYWGRELRTGEPFTPVPLTNEKQQ